MAAQAAPGKAEAVAGMQWESECGQGATCLEMGGAMGTLLAGVWIRSRGART